MSIGIWLPIWAVTQQIKWLLFTNDGEDGQSDSAKSFRTGEEGLREE